MSGQIQNGKQSGRDGQKVYSKKFRTSAVKMVTELGLSAEKAAEQLGCTAQSVHRWVTAHRREALKPLQLQPELNAAKELQAAKKRIRELEKEKERLIKAAMSSAKKQSKHCR